MKCRKPSKPAQHSHTRSTSAPGHQQRLQHNRGSPARRAPLGREGQTTARAGQGAAPHQGGPGDVSTVRHGHGQIQGNAGTKQRPSVSQSQLFLPEIGMDGSSHITFYSICAA